MVGRDVRRHCSGLEGRNMDLGMFVVGVYVEVDNWLRYQAIIEFTMWSLRLSSNARTNAQQPKLASPMRACTSTTTTSPKRDRFGRLHIYFAIHRPETPVNANPSQRRCENVRVALHVRCPKAVELDINHGADINTTRQGRVSEGVHGRVRKMPVQ